MITRDPQRANFRETEMSKFMQKVSFQLARRLSTATLRASGFGPIVSFTFDDAPTTAATVGAPVLEDLGVRGTFYLNGGMLGGVNDIQPLMEAAHVRELARHGHEIGCHTFTHADVRAQDWSTLSADLDRNADRLAELSGVRPKNFAYPYGFICHGQKLRLQSRFATCRGIYPGINEGRIDLGLLKAAPLYHAANVYEQALGWIAANVNTAGWLIFFTHDVRDEPTLFGSTPELLRRCVRAAIDAGCACLTVERALERIRGAARAGAAFHEKSDIGSPRAAEGDQR